MYENSQSLLYEIFLLLFISSHYDISIIHMLQFLELFQFIDNLSLPPPILFFCLISFGEFFKDICSSSLIFALVRSNLQRSPSKSFLISVTVFMTFDTYFLFLAFPYLYLY